MKPDIRDEQPPDDAVVVIRGGLHSLDADRLHDTAEDAYADLGFYGVSVFAAYDGDVRALCERIARLRSPGVIWVARVGTLRAVGFELVPTDEEPHYDVVMPDLAGGTIAALIGCFEARPNPLKEGS